MPRRTVDELREMRRKARDAIYPGNGDLRGKIAVHMGTCGVAAGAEPVRAAFADELQRSGTSDIKLMTTGCAGLCSLEPMATVEIRDLPPVIYGSLNPKKVKKIFRGHILGNKINEKYAVGVGPDADIAFFNKQHPVVLRNRGLIDPEKIGDYLAGEGYSALEKVLTSMKPEEVIGEIIKSGLRGRGGAGFPSGTKWQICRAERKTPKYVIANCDEGDPGAYMDRSLLESDPHSVLEGMIIAAYAIGAEKGYIYVRSEYPLAVKRMTRAIGDARNCGMLGHDVLGSGFDFVVEIREGSGAFVCGEETSLIRSIEGKIPEPSQRPPYPAQVGIWGCPTVINNVETLANVPIIINRSAGWYANIGTQSSKGTKVFSLVGRVKNTGLIEVPMGITLREIIYEIGGGIQKDKRFKAVQTGGPSGGCIPSDLIDLPIDYEGLREAGSMMGSGGMIVMDEDTCMVDVAKFFVEFTSDESCGKCLTCRDGSQALLEVLTRICQGEGRAGDIEFLEELSLTIRDASMCGLGSTLPNPVLSTLRYFREEYVAHIEEKRCPALACRSLVRYYIAPEECVGCLLCLKDCPTGAISGESKAVHVIDQALCSQCGTCLEVCPPRVDAVVKLTGKEARALHTPETVLLEERLPDVESRDQRAVP